MRQSREIRKAETLFQPQHVDQTTPIFVRFILIVGSKNKNVNLILTFYEVNHIADERDTNRYLRESGERDADYYWR